MLYLSDDTVRYAVEQCRNNRNYRVYIALPDKKSCERLSGTLHKYLENSDDYIEMHLMTKMRVAFDNGSYIQTIPASNNARGYRCNLLVVDEFADREIVDTVLRQCELLDYNTHNDVAYISTDTARDIVRWYRNCKRSTSQKEGAEPEYDDVNEAEFLEVLNGI